MTVYRNSNKNQDSPTSTPNNGVDGRGTEAFGILQYKITTTDATTDTTIAYPVRQLYQDIYDPKDEFGGYSEYERPKKSK